MLVRFLQTVIVLCVIGIVLVLFQAGAASTGQVIFSHDYRAPGATEAINFEDPTSLRVFQADLQSSRTDYYAFHAAKGTFLKVKIIVPRLPGLDDFRPALALFGPGLPAPAPIELKLLPFSLPAGVGLQVSEEDKSDKAPQVRLDEPWTQAGYWERQTLLNELPEDGTYFLAVYSLTNQRGKYGLVVGDSAETDLREILTFPVTWARVHYWFDDLWWPTFAAVVLGLALLGLVIFYFRVASQRLRTLAFSSANARRSKLLRKRIRQGWNQRRISQKVRPGKPKSFLPAQPELSSAGPAYVIPAASQVALEEPPLAGSKWEILAGTAPHLAAPATTNGHYTNGKTNLPVEVADGLSQWGQRLRPKQIEKS